jgi:serine/threonine protein kinase
VAALRAALAERHDTPLEVMKPGEPVTTGHLLDGRYRVSKVIGQGGMGRVYLANDTRLANRPVAVKEMIVGAGEHEKKAIEDFAREARVLAALSHPGIPNLIDYFVERGRHYLVMEFVAGGDLQGMLDQLGPGARIAEPKVVRWARQILDVLAFLHGQKPPIVYRDFKPGNIMIDRHNRAMLIDFGIARFLPPGGRGTQIGSVGYAPPEQYMGKAEPRSDLYSLGATMHHLLTGRDPQLEPPFSFPPVRQLAPEVSMQTERVVMRALDREIDKRPSSAREMTDALPVLDEDESIPMVGSSRLPAPLSIIPTVVLPALSPLLAPPAPPPRQENVSGLGRLARIATARSLKNPRRAAALSSHNAAVSPTSKTQELNRNARPPASPRAAAGSAAMAKPSPQALGRGGSGPAGLSAGSAARVQSATPRTLRTPVSRANGGPAVGRGESMASARLVAKTERAEFALAGQRVVIGRNAPAADGVQIDVDLSSLRRGAERVSRRHAEIIRLGKDYFIRDLGSLNGTYVAGRGRLGRDQLYKLRDRDEVVLGGARLEFRKA